MPIPDFAQQTAMCVKAPLPWHAFIEGAVRNLLPGVRFDSRGVALSVELFVKGIRIREADDLTRLHAQAREEGFAVQVRCAGYEWCCREQAGAAGGDPAALEQRVKERIRLGVLHVVSDWLDIPISPWGILTGVRPGKLVHQLMDKGCSRADMAALLADVYGVEPARIALVLDVAALQRSFFPGHPKQSIGLYVGIPFCPTRCRYCSFAGYPLATHSHLVEGFLVALEREIATYSQLLQQLAVPVESVYVGGGTPTALTVVQLERVLHALQPLTSRAAEYTVEAGRPETLQRAVVERLKDYGVDRICINPQTMNDATLQRIGREHTSRDTAAAYAVCRKVGIAHINSDLILGLPQETTADVKRSLQRLGELGPDSMTVHSLAVKRAAELRHLGWDVRPQQLQARAMAEAAAAAAAEWKMQPYYLYRQRYILGDLENVGYAPPGNECIYNIQMMEERQTILGLGAGGVSKLVTADGRLERLTHPKCPATYSSRTAENLSSRLAAVRKYFEQGSVPV